MNNYSKKILKFLNKESPKLYSEKELVKKFKIDPYFLDDIFQILIDNNLVSLQNIINENGETNAYYRSTLKGINYFRELFISNLVKFFYSCLHSLLCPIIVSAITTLITLWLTGLFVTE